MFVQYTPKNQLGEITTESRKRKLPFLYAICQGIPAKNYQKILKGIGLMKHTLLENLVYEWKVQEHITLKV